MRNAPSPRLRALCRAALAVLLLVHCTLLLAALGNSAPPPRPRWVRTVDGWERAEWEMPRTDRREWLHPLVPAALIGLIAASVMVAFPAHDSPRVNRLA